jgi:sugar phosphate isomerase/epimerase
MPVLTRDDVYASFYTLSGAPVTQPSRFTLRQRAQAAARAGLAGIGLSVQDYISLTLASSPSALRAAVDNAGVIVHEIGFVYGWERSGSTERWRHYESRLLEMAEVFDADRLNLGLYQAAPGWFIDDVAETFRGICDRAQEVGLQVALEPMAVSSLSHLSQAEEVLNLAGAPNAGILIDSYHLFRSGDGLAELAQIPPDHIIAIQLNDAPAMLRGDLEEECVSARELPGRGGLDLTELLVTLDVMGVDAPISVEVMSTEFGRLPVYEAAERTAAAVADVRLRALDLIVAAR